MVKLSPSTVLYSKNVNLTMLILALPYYFLFAHINLSSVYKILVTWMLTSTTIQPFVESKVNQDTQNNQIGHPIGLLRGPQPYRKHIVATFSNTEHNKGFIISRENLSRNAAFVFPRSYINPYMYIDETKITFRPDTEDTKKFSYFIHIIAVKPLIWADDGFQVVDFEANNFYKHNLHNQELINYKYKSQKIKKLSIEEYF